MRTPLALGLGLAATTLLAACPGSLDREKFPTADAGATLASCDPTVTVFPARCATAGCHDATIKQAGLDLASPGVTARLLNASAAGGGKLIDPGEPDASVMYTKVTASPPYGGRMPTGSPLSSSEIECIHDWVLLVPGR